MSALADATAQSLPFATSLSGYIGAGAQVVGAGILVRIMHALIRIDKRTTRLEDDAFPPNGPTLADKVNQISEDMAVVKDRGARRPWPQDRDDS